MMESTDATAEVHGWSDKQFYYSREKFRSQLIMS